MKTRLLTLFMVPFLFMACSKTELSDQEKNFDDSMYKKGENSILENTIDYCGDQVIFNISGDGWKWPGNLTVGNDENNFYVTFERRQSYIFTETRLYIGEESSLASLIDPYTNYPDPAILPNLVEHDPGTTSYTYTIPLSELMDDCFSIIAYAVADNGSGPINCWAGNLTVGGAKPRPYYFNICVEPCQPSTSCETAFAWGDEYATCFIDIPDLNGNRWGWTNGPLPAGNYDFEIWAAAGQCDLSKGTFVGTLNIEYDGSSATVTYSMVDEFTLNETHMYIGNEILPQKNNGQWTVAPGQYPYKDDDLNGANTHTYVADGLSGDIYVIGHAVVCGDFPMNTSNSQ